MANTLQVERLTAGTLFRLILIGWLFPWIALGVLYAVVALCGGKNLASVDGQQVTGITAAAVILFLTFFGWIFSSIVVFVNIFIGLWLYSLVRPTSISYLPALRDI